jgi:hypothetical protein
VPGSGLLDAGEWLRAILAVTDDRTPSPDEEVTLPIRCIFGARDICRLDDVRPGIAGR